jgi:hypothetical protein
VALALEYLEPALLEAEAAARWYAERSPSAALAFSDEMVLAAPFFPFSVVYRVDSGAPGRRGARQATAWILEIQRLARHS